MKRVIHKSTETGSAVLPEVLDISLDEFVEAYPDWVLWRAFDKRYPPSVIRQQPRWLLKSFMYLEYMLDKMLAEKHEQDKLAQEASNG